VTDSSDLSLCAVQYAGNVLVMGAITPCDGDWYGGLRADDAETFVNALTNVEVLTCLFQLCMTHTFDYIWSEF